jgi:hypothetical protein
MPREFSRAVTHKLGHYVYIYIDPTNDQIFYVGKGVGNRAFAHLDAAGPSAKTQRIKEIRGANMEPRIEILVHGLKDEETALKVEAAMIDLLGIDNLTNEVRGYQSRSHGRMRLNQIKALYDAKEVEITEPSILIRIAKGYRHTMTPRELYERTRAYWKVGPKRDRAKLAFAVYAGVVREVYEIAAWFPAFSIFTAEQREADRLRDRWEFVGRIADETIRKKYVYRSVAHYIPKYSQSPILYVNVD